jgi:outer membrane protein
MNPKNQRGRGVVLGIFCLLTAFTQPSFAYDFLEIYTLAKTNDPTIENARQAMLAAGYRIDQAVAGWLPNVGMTGANQRVHGDYQFGNPSTVSQRQSDNWNWAVQLTQPLWKPVQSQMVTQAEKAKIQFEAQYAQAKQELFSRVATAYFAVETAQQSVIATQAAVDAGAAQFAIAQKGFEQGTHSVADREDAKAKWELAKSQRVGAQTELDTQFAELEKITGSLTTLQNANPKLSPLQPLAQLLPIEPSNIKDWVARARADSPIVQAKMAAVSVAESEIAKNRLAHLPTLDFVAARTKSYASGSNTPLDYESRTWVGTAGLQMTIPLFAGNINVAKTSEAIAQYHAATADLEAAQRAVESSAVSAFKAVGNHRAQIEALNAAIESAKVALAGNQAGLRLGLKIRFDVLLAEQQLATAKRDWVKARYDAVLQSIKLKVAAGQMSEMDVQNWNQLFMPNKTSESTK